MFTIKLLVIDGARTVFQGGRLLVHIRDDGGKNLISRFVDANPVSFTLPVDAGAPPRNVAVIVTRSGYKDAGFFPVPITEGGQVEVRIMLAPKEPEFTFERGLLGEASTADPESLRLLRSGAAPDERYEALIESGTRRPAAACLLNILAAIRALPNGPEIVRLLRRVELIPRTDDRWAGLQQDRVFAVAHKDLRQALDSRSDFEEAPADLHPGAEVSFKEVRFGEGNLQFSLTKAGGEGAKIDPIGAEEIGADIDMDLFRDLGAHALFEVIPNHLKRLFGVESRTDPRRIYVVRWIAGANQRPVEPFQPLYRLTG